jgi:hypothetical protein
MSKKTNTNVYMDTKEINKLVEAVDTMVKNIKNMFNKVKVQNLSQVIQAIEKYDIEVDQDTLEIGTKITSSIVDNGETYTWTLSDGEYHLDDGRVIQVDADGIIVLISDGDTTKNNDEEMAEKLEGQENLELTLESLEEQLIALTQVVAELTVKVDEMKPVEEEVIEEEEEELEVILPTEKETELEKTNTELLSKIEELESKIPATEIVLNKDEISKDLSKKEIWLAKKANTRK